MTHAPHQDELPVALRAALSGTALIEASAGTGKTWTISGLYVRLVVEKGLAVEQILTVTFTRAATAELRERIRCRLQEVQAALQGREGTDSFCTELARRIADREAALKHIALALADFDRAAVHTIHGFCQRALAERAFSSGVPFASELLADLRPVLDEAVQDFWRREVAHGPDHAAGRPHARTAHERFVACVLAQCESPQRLGAWAQGMLSRHEMRVVAASAAGDIEACVAAVEELRPRLAALWRREREAILGLLLAEPSPLKRTSYAVAAIPRWAEEIDLHFAGGDAQPPACLDKFTEVRLAASVKKNHAAPEHVFFAAAQVYLERANALDAACRAAVAQWRARLLGWLREELPRRLREQRAQGYDDLLRNLHGALQAPDGERLAAALRARYPAALVDEFQDTDALQYAIFRRMYRDGGHCALFFVGDPKQAIYSFRGADLFAYLAAAADCGERYTLDTNQRSVPGLVSAINVVFAGAPRPFRFDAIAFHPVLAANKQRAALVEAGGRDASPLRFMLAPGGERIGKGQARDWAVATVAAEVARLLAGARAGVIRLGDQPLQARDMAVLVADRYQAAAVRDALRVAGVSCAEQSRQSVFHTPEAEALERLLLAVAEPQREGLVRAALGGPFFGLDAAALARLDEDELAWEARAVQFRACHDAWRDAGFMRMLRRLMIDHQVAARLAAQAGGERRLTNVFHLAELLHAQSQRTHGMEGLINWLASQRREARESEEAQLRLESDENLVQVVTVHLSKGLEYPVVFCPFLWDGKARAAQGDDVFYHDPAAAFEPVLELGTPSDAARRQAREEELAERLRLAYVALTRARNRCYVLWGNIREAGASPLAWLLHHVDGDDGALPGTEGMRARIGELAAASGGSVMLVQAIEDAPPPSRTPAAVTLAARVLPRALPAPWRLASFTSLASAGAEEWRAEVPDYAQRTGDEAPRAADGSRFGFPRGADAGTCLHAMLENMDFSAPAAARNGIIARALAQHGYPAAWQGEVDAWLAQVLHTPLAREGNLALHRLARAGTVRELEFHLPLDGFGVPRLQALLAAHGVAAPALAGDTLQGYLKGYIDLVFEHGGRYYLADYKSNWLGERPEDYAPPRLAQAMAREGYALQALLYTAALHRWLARRVAGYDYGRHFGGAFYLFLRGMSPAWDDAQGACGVHVVRPVPALVSALDALLGRRAGEAA